MPISDIYTGSGTSTQAGGPISATPVCSLVTGPDVRAFIVGVRIGIGATAATSGNVLFQLFRVTNATAIAGGTTGGTSANDPNAPAATETFLYAGATAYTTAPTGETNLLWQQELPNTTGSSWEEFPPLGYEYVLNTSAGVALWVTSASSASATYSFELVWSH